MPLPTPHKNEKEQAFVSRCIETVTKHEKDKWPNPKQRDAICYSQWREAGHKDTLAKKKDKKTEKK